MRNIQIDHAEKMLYLGNLHSELKEYKIANLAYNQILQLTHNSEIITNHKAQAHLGLANICFINNKKRDGKKHIENALRTGPTYKGSEYYFLYTKAKELYTKYAPYALVKLAEDSTKIFPLFPEPFVELIGHYNKKIKEDGNLEALLNKQKIVLSRMAANLNGFETDPTEKKQFKEITIFLAMEYFNCAKQVKDETKIADEKWRWDFEVNDWLKVNGSLETQLHLISYDNVNSVKQEYLIKAKSITKKDNGDYETYFFAADNLMIKLIGSNKNRYALKNNYTLAETISSHLEDAISNYFNKILLKSKKENLIEFLTENKLIKKSKKTVEKKEEPKKPEESK